MKPVKIDYKFGLRCGDKVYPLYSHLDGYKIWKIISAKEVCKEIFSVTQCSLWLYI